ncbi:MAG: hypothetical protein JNM85_11395 [Chthonomonas sp.]|nr:hypothetical protein [Chthonomonas sp.]
MSDLPPLDPQDAEKLEFLERQLRILRNRGDQAGVQKTFEEMLSLAPNNTKVLEAAGDEFLVRGQRSKAREAYKRAFELDPTNASAETKFAETVFAMDAADVSKLLGTSEFELSSVGKLAVVQSLLVPGLGQTTTGRTQVGAMMMFGYIVGLLITLLTPGGLSGIFTALGMSGSRVPFNPLVLLGIALAVGTYLWSLIDMRAATANIKRTVIVHPKPPVDKDFEI